MPALDERAAFAQLLTAHRQRSFGFGYVHILLFGAIVAIGSGLHTAAFLLDHRSRLDAIGTVTAVATPMYVYVVVFYRTQGLLGWSALGITAVLSIIFI